MLESVVDWDPLRLLVEVADRGSLRAAARSVGLSQPTLGRRLRALEDDLGVPLLLRHARGVSLTPDGAAAVEAAREVHTRVEALRRGLAGRVSRVAGRVRLSCTEPVGCELLPPSLARLRADHPELGVDVVMDAHASDLERREADVVVRMFQPRRASLIARRVGSTCTRFYAARSYVEGRKMPETLADLLDHEMIAPDRDPLFVGQARELGMDLSMAAHRTDSFSATLAWVRAGLGIGALLEAVADAELVPLLDPIRHHPVWLVTHPDLFGSAAVRAVWDRLATDLPAVFPGTAPTPPDGP